MRCNLADCSICREAAAKSASVAKGLGGGGISGTVDPRVPRRPSFPTIIRQILDVEEKKQYAKLDKTAEYRRICFRRLDDLADVRRQLDSNITASEEVFDGWLRKALGIGPKDALDLTDVSVEVS